MPGTTYLYITKDFKVIKVPHPKDSVFKAVPLLKNQEILMVDIVYLLENRVPKEILYLSFSRIQLDNYGVYDISKHMGDKKLLSKINFMFATLELLSESDHPLQIPIAPDIPNQYEREALLDYIKVHLPALYSQAPYKIFELISRLEKIHRKEKKIVIEAAKRRNKK